jgi:hypothetical protein
VERRGFAIGHLCCHANEVRPSHLTIMLGNAGQIVSVDDALVCAACGEERIDERAAAFLLSHRSLAPQAQMSVTVSWRSLAGLRAPAGGPTWTFV